MMSRKYYLNVITAERRDRMMPRLCGKLIRGTSIDTVIGFVTPQNSESSEDKEGRLAYPIANGKQRRVQ